MGMDEITIGDKVYVSSKRAAKITGYAKDYVGQLCREGRVEARLVGRNWYVLESAIREHRFGADQKTASQPADETTEFVVEDRSSTWQRPSYAPEIPVVVPELTAKQPQEPTSSPAIADMQSAWREWFADKTPMEALPDGMEDFKDEYLPLVMPEEQAEIQEVETVTLQRIEEATAQPTENQAEEGGEIEIHKSYASRETGELTPRTNVPMVDLSQQRFTAQLHNRKSMPTKAQKASGSGAVRAVLVVVAIFAALVATVGTGHADRFISGTSVDFGVQKTIIDFLGGKSSYNSSL